MVTALPSSPPQPNSYWVLKGRLLAGEYPGGFVSLDARHNLNLFLEAGIDTFFDLTVNGERASYQRFLPEGVTHQRFPIPNRGVPAHPRDMMAIISALDEALSQGRRVYLHCQGGVGRTGTALACWFQHHGRTPKESLRHLARLYRQANRSARLTQIPENAVQLNWVMQWPALSASLTQALSEPPQTWTAPVRRSPRRLVLPWPWRTA